MNKQFKQVTEFNKAFNLPINVDEVKEKDIDLRKKLLLEELDEYWEGIQMHIHSEEKQYPEEARKKAIREIFDALIDIKYVLIGVYVYCGYSYRNELNLINQHDIGMMNYDDSFNKYREIEELITNFENKSDLDKINNKVNYLLAEHGMLEYFELGFDEVHASNMSKLCRNESEAKETVKNYKSLNVECRYAKNNDSYIVYRHDKKVLKGQDYFKPNLKQIINK